MEQLLGKGSDYEEASAEHPGMLAVFFIWVVVEMYSLSEDPLNCPVMFYAQKMWFTFHKFKKARI